MARPPKPEGEARENVLRIRLTDDERRLLDQVAQGKTLDTSTWARSELVALAKKILKQERS
jgi:uncharacterized protein (DUF1778 family)